jgi:hypothetical protein
MRTLVGVPCFRISEQVNRCLISLVNTAADVLAIDNAADGDVKGVLHSLRNRIKVISSPTNEYCNGGWNRILKYGLDNGYDIIGLGSSDVILNSGWHEALQGRAAVVSDEVWLPRIGEPSNGVEHVYGGVAGFLTFLPRKAAEIVYPIPVGLKMWFGDEFMYGKVRAAGFKVTIINALKAQHEWSSVTAATPEAYAVIEQDKIEWHRLTQQ